MKWFKVEIQTIWLGIQVHERITRREQKTEEDNGGKHMNQRKIGQFIAQRRKERNMTQKQLAEEIGVSDKTISKWETGASPT